MEGFGETVDLGYKFRRVANAFNKAAPYLGAVGFVLGIAELFVGSEHDHVMEKLEMLTNKIEALESTMQREFDLVNHNADRRACYNKVFEDERKILEASRALGLISKNYSHAEDRARY